MYSNFKSAGEKLFLSGVNDTHSGNISLKEDNKIFITSRSAQLSDLKESDIIEASFDDEAADSKNVSSDLSIHRLIYKIKDAKAIIHAHPPNALALCVTENKILPQDMKGQSLFPQGISIIKTKPGTDPDEISRQLTGPISESRNLIIIKGYGTFAYAGSVDEALEITTSLELSSKIWLFSKLIPVKQAPAYPQSQNRFDQRKRSAIPQGIGVMGRRTGGYGRRDIKR